MQKVIPVSLSLQPGLSSVQEEWTVGRHRHKHDINTLRCQRQPMYGRDLVHTIRSLCHQGDRRTTPSSAAPPSSSSSSSPATPGEGAWLWAGFLACQRLQTEGRPEEGGYGCLALSHALLSYQTRAAMMEETIRRYANLFFPLSHLLLFLHNAEMHA